MLDHQLDPDGYSASPHNPKFYSFFQEQRFNKFQPRALWFDTDSLDQIRSSRLGKSFCIDHFMDKGPVVPDHSWFAATSNRCTHSPPK